MRRERALPASLPAGPVLHGVRPRSEDAMDGESSTTASDDQHDELDGAQSAQVYAGINLWFITLKL